MNISEIHKLSHTLTSENMALYQNSDENHLLLYKNIPLEADWLSPTPANKEKMKTGEVSV